ncbi:MAG: TAXI family TRAP transporter solute-binding subunit [Chloroflexi bacterium]|nr:TAXI family TRAP transporter solute-binding subunit [Chloroflexota bacterium]
MRKQALAWPILVLIAVLLAAACGTRPTPTPAATPAAAPASPAARAPTPAPATPTPAAPAPARPSPSPAARMPPVMSIATAGVGTTSYIVASAFSELISKYAGTKITVEPSGAAARWIPLTKTKDIDLAIHCSTTDVRDAYYGEFYWKDQGPHPVLQVAIGQDQPYGFNTVDPNIKSLADLKGKKIYAYMKGMRILNDLVPLVLREAGVRPEDVELLTYADVNEAAKGIQEGKAVGVWYIPTVLPLVELDRAKPLYGVPVPAEVVLKAKEQFPELHPGTWKKGEGISKSDMPYVFYPCGMAGRADLDPDTVYTFLSTVYAHYDEYKDKHPIMRWWTPEQGISIVASPVHPGAVRYFKEKGLWKDEQEKLQQKLQARPRG